MLVVLVAMMLGSRDPLALAYVCPPFVAAFNHMETNEKDDGYYGGLEDDEMDNCDLAS